MKQITSTLSDLLPKPLSGLLNLVERIITRPLSSLLDRFELVTPDHPGQKEQRQALESLEKRHQAIIPRLDAAGLDLIARFEGFAPRIYKDLAGYPTIGYGHLLKAGEAERFADGISKDQARILLRRDASSAERAVRELVTVPLNQHQFNALVSFVFNVGRNNFERSTLLRELNRGHYEAVAPQLQRWIHAGGQRIEGLVNRRRAEAELFNRPEQVGRDDTA